ncbi:MAG: spore coat protein CotJB [Clostridia bacterium]|nr:spore coat protein CotJB [Clostridia bacterium]
MSDNVSSSFIKVTSFTNTNITSCDADQLNATREEMMERIKCLNFAIIELGLYLDTHPDDEKALCLHRKYCKEYRDLTDKYQKVYGPLTIKFPCNKWRWLEEPWPWERGNF